MADVREMLAWRGREVVDVDGDRIGRLEEIYLDADTDEAHWAAVKTGLVGGKLSLVPLAEATERADLVAIPFDKRTVKGAPNVDSGAELTPEEESMLHRYYGTGESSRAGGAAEQPERRDSRDETASRSETHSHRGTDSRGGGRGREFGRALGAAARNVGQAAMQEARGRGSSAESDRGPHAGEPAGGDERSGRGGAADDRSLETDRRPATSGPGDQPASSDAEAGRSPQTSEHGGETQRRADEPEGRVGERRPHAEEQGRQPHDPAHDSEQPARQTSAPAQTGESPHTADGDQPRAEQQREPGEERPRGRLRRHVTTEYLSDAGEVERRETHTEEERPR